MNDVNVYMYVHGVILFLSLSALEPLKKAEEGAI